MNYFFWALLTVTTLTSITVNGQSNVNVAYGSATDSDNASIFTNQAGTGFDSTTTAVLAFGWSDDFSASLSFNDYLANFNVLGWTNFNSVDSAAPGYLPATANFDNDIVEAAGKTGYLMVLAGITDFSNSSDATEFAIIGNSSWEVVPSGGLTPDSWDLTSLNNVDNLLYGTQTASGIGSGYAFGTLAVPEPSNYASIIGFMALSLALLRRRGVMVKNL